MKKLFISCPMKGRTKEAIMKSMEQMHKVAEIMFGEELEVIETYIEENAPKGIKERIWYLGKSIEKMAEADYFIGCIGTNAICGELEFPGCEIERHVAIEYGIQYGEISIIDYKCFNDIVK